MKIATPKQRLILEAAIDGSVIRGTLTAPTGERRDFHGWLVELEEAVLSSDHTEKQLDVEWLYAWAYKATRPSRDNLADRIRILS